MKTMHKSLMIVALTLALSSATNAYAFERGGGERGGYDRHENFSQPYHHNYNQEGRAYNTGFNRGMNEGNNGGGTTVVQPNSSFEQLEQYGNPNSAANQNMRANQQMQGGQ